MNTEELIKAINEEHGDLFENCWKCTYGTHNGEIVEKLRRLAELEDKLESGELVELPCLVNTSSPKYKVIVFRGIDGALYKTHYFETREAEVKLKELQEKGKRGGSL